MLSLHYKGREIHDYGEFDDEEPSYDDDDYDWIDHNDTRYEDIYEGWPCTGPMILDKMDLEAEFFT